MLSTQPAATRLKPQHPAAQHQAGRATEVPHAIMITTQTDRQTRELPDATVQTLKRSRQVTIILAVSSVRRASD